MKMTNINMDWTDSGAYVSNVSTNGPTLNCPRCGTQVPPNTVHTCGDKDTTKKKRVLRK